MTPLVKICGITRVEDALGSARVGADFLGYIFYAPSKRFVPPRSAKQIISKVRQDYPTVKHVGVFVDEIPANIAWIRNLAGLDYVQLHGSETPQECNELADLGIDVIKALGIDKQGARAKHSDFKVPYYLCDSYDPASKGGTGKLFDLSLLPSDLQTDILFLAGGLTPDNVVEVMAAVHPYAVDVSSGVEVSAGKKDLLLVEKFINRVHAGHRILTNEDNEL